MASFEDAAATLSSVDETGLSSVSKLAQQQLSIERRIAELEDMVSDAKKELREVSEELLPSAMAEHGISELKLSDGSEITVGKFYSASISKAKSDEAFEWLNTKGFGDLIKNQVSTKFVRGQEEQAQESAIKDPKTELTSLKFVQQDDIHTLLADPFNTTKKTKPLSIC